MSLLQLTFWLFASWSSSGSSAFLFSSPAHNCALMKVGPRGIESFCHLYRIINQPNLPKSFSRSLNFSKKETIWCSRVSSATMKRKTRLGNASSSGGEHNGNEEIVSTACSTSAFIVYFLINLFLSIFF